MHQDHQVQLGRSLEHQDEKVPLIYIANHSIIQSLKETIPILLVLLRERSLLDRLIRLDLELLRLQDHYRLLSAYSLQLVDYVLSPTHLHLTSSLLHLLLQVHEPNVPKLVILFFLGLVFNPI